MMSLGSNDLGPLRARFIRRVCQRSGALALVHLLIGGVAVSAQAETVIAVGSTYGETQPDASVEDKPLILVSASGEWRRVDPVAISGSLLGIVSDSARRVWAFGSSAEAPLLLQSTDGGASWTDVSAAFTTVAADQIPVAMAFRTDQSGWIASRGRYTGGPYLFATNDGGRTWASVPDTGYRHAFGTYALRVPSGDVDAVELAVSDPNGISLRQASKSGVTVEQVATAEEMRAWAFTSAGDTWWMLGREETGSGGADVPAIRRLDAKRETLRRIIDMPGWTDVRAVHFLDAQTALAGGETVADARLPLLLWTRDGGAVWERAALPEGLSGGRIAAVVLTDAQSGWAAFNYVGRTGTVFLRTTDGGRQWAEASGGIPTGRLRAFLAIGQ